MPAQALEPLFHLVRLVWNVHQPEAAAVGEPATNGGGRPALAQFFRCAGVVIHNEHPPRRRNVHRVLQGNRPIIGDLLDMQRRKRLGKAHVDTILHGETMRASCCTAALSHNGRYEWRGRCDAAHLKSHEATADGDDLPRRIGGNAVQE